MDRLTERDEFGNADIIALSDIIPEIYAGLSFSETNALRNVLNRLAAYEDTGLTPEEVDRLNALYAMRDKQLVESMVENERLKKRLEQIAYIAGRVETD